MDNSEQETNEKGLVVVDSLLNKPAKDTVALIKEAVENGDVNPTYMGVTLKKMAKIQELVKKDPVLQHIIEQDTLNHQEGTAKTFSAYGAKITVASTGFWDYSKTEDEQLKKLKEIEKTVKETIKLREAHLQSLAANWSIRNSPLSIQESGLKPFTVNWEHLPELVWEEQFGEVDTNPPTKKGKESLRYTV